MTTQFDVCVVGSANLDLVATTDRLPGPGETVMGFDFAEYPGGKGLNQAVAAARAGARVGFVGAVGNDDAAATLLGVMRADGIATDGVAHVGVPTGRALIGVSSTGENSIIVVPGANATVRIEALATTRVLLLQLEVPVATVVDALTAARAQGAITLLNPAPVQPLDESVLSLCDIVIPNEHEVQLLGGAERLLALGARAVVVTRGAQGADLHTAQGVTHSPAFAVAPIDTTAAGDAFCGALAARLAVGDELAEAIRYALAGGALATTKAGAVPSLATLAEIEALLTSAA